MLYKDYCVSKRDYQEEGTRFLLERKHACLFYKPGKGKTYPCIEAIRTVDKMRGSKGANVLIMSTADAIKNMWKAEIAVQGILPENTQMVTFNAAIVDKTAKDLLSKRWDVIVIDECHKIKSRSAQISKLVYKLSKCVEYVWGLSGTPRGNCDVDIYCQFHNMRIGDWGNINYTTFVNTMCDIDTRYFNGVQVKIPTGIRDLYKGVWDRSVEMYTQRVEYTEDDDMPELDVNVVRLPYEKTNEYKDAEAGIMRVPDYETTMTKLAAVTKCHQAVNGFLYYPDEDGGRITYRISGPNQKIEWLKANVKSEPTVIVYRFEEDLKNIEGFCYDNGHNPTENVDAFKRGENDILLLQCSRCESFNLQMCKRIIFYTLDYSYIKYNQMLHRVWRMGQNQNVEIVVLVYDKTVETSIWKSVSNKEKLADLFMRAKNENG